MSTTPAAKLTNENLYSEPGARLLDTIAIMRELDFGEEFIAAAALTYGAGSERGKECLDMIIALRAKSFSDETIAAAVLTFWMGDDFHPSGTTPPTGSAD
jgi:hypothetical protein